MKHIAGSMAIACLVGLAPPPLNATHDQQSVKQGLTHLSDGGATADLSANGRFVAFESRAPLLPVDVNDEQDIYVLDLVHHWLTLESRAADGHSANGRSRQPRLSADGRYVVFESDATNIDGTQAGQGLTQVFLSDRLNGVVRLISRTPARQPGNSASHSPDISDDGRIVAFTSGATDLVAGVDRNGATTDVFVFDTVREAITRVSVSSDDTQPPAGSSGAPRVSGDGQFVAFRSRAPLTGAIDPMNAAREVDRTQHVFLRDLRTSTTQLVSRTSDGRTPNGSSWAPAISGDGRFVAYTSLATNLARDDRNGSADVFVHDVRTSRTTLASRGPTGTPAGGASMHPAISNDGRLVAFVTDAGDLLCVGRRCPPDCLDLNLVSDIYLVDMQTGMVQRVSGASGGEPWWDASVGPALDAAGALVAFSSRHPLDATDLSYDYDLIVRSIDTTPIGRAMAKSIVAIHNSATQH